MTRPEFDLSRNCREAMDEGRTPDAHVCTGCGDCPCHHVPPPAPLRELIKRAKAGEDQ